MKIQKSGHWLFEVNKALQLLQMNNKYSKNKYFSFFLTKNLNAFKLLLEDFKPLIDSIQPSEKYKEYEQKSIELLDQYAQKDSYGRYKYAINNKTGEQQIACKDVATAEEYKEKSKALLEEYNDVVKENEVNINEADTVLEKEMDIEVFKISFNMIPDDVDVSLIRDLIVETDEEIEKIITSKAIAKSSPEVSQN